MWRFLRNRRLFLRLHRPTIFMALTYWVHRAVIIAIAWFPCLKSENNVKYVFSNTGVHSGGIASNLSWEYHTIPYHVQLIKYLTKCKQYNNSSWGWTPETKRVSVQCWQRGEVCGKERWAQSSLQRLVWKCWQSCRRFLPRDASAERGNATVSRLSVCNV